MSAEIICLLMTLRDQVKIYHWQTMKYPRHAATDELVGKLDENIDKFVEVYIGKYGRPNFTSKTSSIKIHNFHDADGPSYLKSAATWLSKKLPKHVKKEDTDLLNIRDEILADLNQTLYLFTLH
jgi:hypothetical protein